jgi:hypothetical protein
VVAVTAVEAGVVIELGDVVVICLGSDSDPGHCCADLPAPASTKPSTWHSTVRARPDRTAFGMNPEGSCSTWPTTSMTACCRLVLAPGGLNER